MAIELTTASPETINNIRNALSAANSFKIQAKKSFTRNIYADNPDYTINYQNVEGVGKIYISITPTEGVYIRGFLRRLVQKFDGDTVQNNYTNLKAIMYNEVEGEQIIANITNVFSDDGNNNNFEITIDQNPEEYNLLILEFVYDFNNVNTLDVENDYFGMATDNDDIDIISGRDIDLRAADDIYISAGSYFVLEHYRLDGQNEEEGIELITNNDGNQYTWMFDFQGKLRLPGSGAQIAVEEEGTAVRIGNGSLNTAPSNHIQVGGDQAFEVFGGPPGYSYKFDRNHTLTLPPSGTLSADGGAFNGGHLQFIGGASGDGNGYSTIELHPDNTRSEYDQYIIIDPTAPNHIHIRAGGEQDNAGAELILGGENSHYAISAGSNPSIRAVANGNTWTFENNGYLYFPDGGSLKFKGSAPGTSIGTEGDVPSMIAIDSDYIYYCIAPWDGVSNIWKRVALVGGAW